MNKHRPNSIDETDVGNLTAEELADLLRRGREFGDYPDHGRSTRTIAPTATGSVTTFEPKYLCLFYLQFGAGPIKIRQAYTKFTAPPVSDQDVAILATPILEQMAGHVPSTQPALATYRNGITDFGFGSQQILMIFIDNKDNETRFRDDPSLEHIVTFAPFSSQDPLRAIRPNNNFFNIRPVAIASTKLTSSLSYCLDFWNRNKDGNEITIVPGNDETFYWYAMNIHIEMAAESAVSGTNDWVPMVFDPDTGNMGSQP